MIELQKWLIDHGYFGFHISVSRQITYAIKDECVYPVIFEPFIEVEFFDLESLWRHETHTCHK
jgi:hypothetical protein